MSFASASAAIVQSKRVRIDFLGMQKTQMFSAHLACYWAIKLPSLTRNNVFEERLKTRMIGTQRVFQYKSHGSNALVAQLFVDKG